MVDAPISSVDGMSSRFKELTVIADSGGDEGRMPRHAVGRVGLSFLPEMDGVPVAGIMHASGRVSAIFAAAIFRLL